MKRILAIGLLVSMAAGLSFAQSSGGSSSPPVSSDQTAPAAAPNPAKPAPARISQAQSAPAQRAPVIVQPIITNPPVVNNHYYGKVYNPPAQAQGPAPTTIIIPIPVPTAPVTVPAAPAAAQSPQAVPAVPPPAPASAALPRRDPRAGYIIPAGPPRRTIRGVLGVERGMVTLTDASEVRWFVMGLERYIGLIEGLNIGEEAEIKGYAPAASNGAQERFFQPLTLILEGAEYDIGPLSAATRAGAFSQDRSSRKDAWPTPPQVQAAQPVQTVPVQTPVQPGAVQTAGGFLYQPIIIQPAPPPREEKYVPWVHVHTSPWAPHYGAVGKDIDTSSFWNQQDGVWW